MLLIRAIFTVKIKMYSVEDDIYSEKTIISLVVNEYHSP